MAFVFYDTETTGTNWFFNQILQFAAILTDDNLNEIERFEIRSRLQPHILASPSAMNVTNVTVEQLHDPSLPSHYEMICKIRDKLLSWEPAQFIGHNSIKFDEILLRSAFYQSLLPPYLTNTKGNSRLDTLPMLQMASIFEPGGISVPLKNGKPSFSLEFLAPANGFNRSNAHEATSDVEATIYMYKMVQENAPDTLSRFMRFSQKASVIDFCETEEMFGFTEFYFGNPYTVILHTIGRNPDDANEIFAFHLLYDPQELIGYSGQELQSFIGQSPKPLRRFRANALPALSDVEDAHPLSNIHEMSLATLEMRAGFLAANPDLKQRLMDAYFATKADYDSSPHVEENLYTAFATKEDNTLMESFHDAEWVDRYAISCKFSDPRYHELGERLIFIEAPDCLPLQRRQYWKTYFAKRLLGEGDPCKALTLPDAIQQADDLLDNSEDEKFMLLDAHRAKLVKQHEALRLSYNHQ